VRLLAWLFVVVVLAASLGGAYWALRAVIGREKEQNGNQSVDRRQCPECARRGDTSAVERDGLYDQAEPVAKTIKTALQMLIGIAAVCIIGWHFIAGSASDPEPAIPQLLDGIGIALAAAAVIELAYTLFTKGPDEALDPLMLAIAATLIIQVGKYPEEKRPNTEVANAGDLLLLGILLAVLFLVRLMLSERHHGDEPRIWWIKRLERRSTAASPFDKGDKGTPT
jgi:hypothetical protein